MQKQRYSYNENSAKRWVWELCQNAKDVCNSTGKVKICIDFDEGQRKVFFRHNGKAFSIDNIVSLINQASSKDRNDGSARKSGIIAAMEKAVSDLEKCTSIDIFNFNEDGYNTVFEYELDEYGMQTARDGLESLRVSAPFVLAVLPEIEEITVENTGEKFRYKQEIECKLEKATVSEIEIEKKENSVINMF